MAWPSTGWATGAATTTASDGLRFRSGAGKNYSTYQVLPYGTGLQITGQAVQSGGIPWVPVTYNGRSGWISGNYLQGTANPSTGGSGIPPVSTTPTPYPQQGAWKSGQVPAFPTYPGQGQSSQYAYYNPHSNYGGDRDWATTPAIGGPDGYLEQNPEAAYNRFISGIANDEGNLARWLRSQYQPTVEGYEAAFASNPQLTFQTYLAGLGPQQYMGRFNDLTPRQRGESSGDFYGGRTQWLY